MTETIQVRELSLDYLRPNTASVETDIGGMKIVVVGKPGSGKSTIIKHLILSKRHLVPAAVVISGSEETNGFYRGLVPDAFIYNQFSTSIIDRIKERQVLAKNLLGKHSWLLLVIDDCMDDPKLFVDKAVQGLFKNGRHWNLFLVLASQYVMDLKPVIRAAVDGVFIFREHNVTYKDKLYVNFASVVPSKKMFYRVMDEITQNHTALYVDNTLPNAEDWTECLRYYRAPSTNPRGVFGCKDYWQFGLRRGTFKQPFPVEFTERMKAADAPLDVTGSPDVPIALNDDKEPNREDD